MGGLLNALNAGRTSLATNQKAIEITGNNIANVNTPGYSRQEPVLTPYPALNFGDFFIGQGVKISDIQRQYDAFTSAQLLDKSKTYGEENAKATPLAELERVFTISENSLATEIDRFFDSWQELTVNPGGPVERDIVLQRGNLLGKAFNGAVEQLDAVRRDINATLASKIDAVNANLQEVADLNQQIAAIETSGRSANSFRDRRDLLLQNLSESLGVQTVEENTGMVSVQMPGGLPLVQGNTALDLEGVTVGDDLVFQLQQGATTLPVNRDKLGGAFGGLVDVRDNFIPELHAELDRMAYELANQVNALHQGGSGLDGVTGRSFFAPMAGSSDAARQLVVALQGGPEIAAGASAAPGDNTNALRIAALGKDKVIDGNDTFVSFYGKLTAKVGLEAGQNRLTLDGTSDALLQLRNLRESKVGVSVEEEMINLIQYQKGFEASAKFLSTVDEMMDTLLSLKR